MNALECFGRITLVVGIVLVGYGGAHAGFGNNVPSPTGIKVDGPVVGGRIMGAARIASAPVFVGRGFNFACTLANETASSITVRLGVGTDEGSAHIEDSLVIPAYGALYREFDTEPGIYRCRFDIGTAKPKQVRASALVMEENGSGGSVSTFLVVPAN